MSLGTLLLMSMLAGEPRPALRYLALGDSYSIGESVAAEMRWPNVLVEKLRARGHHLAPAEIFARTGWTTEELEAALKGAERGARVELATAEFARRPSPPYQLVSLLIGVNDQYRGQQVSSYQPRFSNLLERAIAYAGGHSERVLVLSIPDWGVTPFARKHGRDPAQMAREIDAYNAAAAAECGRLGVEFIDITPLTREAATRSELLAADGLHPSGLDYARWAEQALPAALRALDSR